MVISLANAIKSVKEDENWLKKCLIGGILILLSNLSAIPISNFSVRITLLLISFLAICYYLGFWLSTGNKMINGTEDKMAEWSQVNLLWLGLKYTFASIGYTLLLVIASILFSFLMFIVVLLIGVIVYAILAISHNTGNNVISFFASLLIGIAGIVETLYILQFVQMMMISYFKTLKIEDMFNFKKHFNIIKSNQHASWTLVGKTILFILLFTLIFCALVITLVGVVLIPFVLFIGYIVMANLYAQYGRHVKIEQYL